MLIKPVALLSLLAAGGLAGCAGASIPSNTSDAPALARASVSSGKIQHIVIIVQENRTFDNLFDCFKGTDCVTTAPGPGASPGPYAPSSPCPVLNAPSPGPTPTPIAILFHTPLKEKDDPGHTYCPTFKMEYDGGRMDGFAYVDSLKIPIKNFVYRVTDPKDIKPYWALAQQYVLADRAFPTEFSASYTAHQTLIRGDATYEPNVSLVDLPIDNKDHRSNWGCDDTPGTQTPLLSMDGDYSLDGPFPCMTYQTMRDTLEAKGVSWRYYVPPWPIQGGQMWNAFDGISAVRYSKEWPNHGERPFTCNATLNCVSWPNTNIFCDVAGTTGTKKCPSPNPNGAVELPGVSWVIPTGPESDHQTFNKAGTKVVDVGPDWVASVVNAIGESKYWNSTAIIITWDDWGGFWDHVPPPQLDYRGLGFRVPLIIVSPYAKKGYVSHTQYEFGSILKFAETTFGLASLDTTDVRANNLTDAFDFSQKPRAFVEIPPQTKGQDKAYFMSLPPDNNPVDTE
jgi:phospholipase C